MARRRSFWKWARRAPAMAVAGVVAALFVLVVVVGAALRLFMPATGDTMTRPPDNKPKPNADGWTGWPEWADDAATLAEDAIRKLWNKARG
jgi:hypothetical protein